MLPTLRDLFPVLISLKWPPKLKTVSLDLPLLVIRFNPYQPWTFPELEEPPKVWKCSEKLCRLTALDSYDSVWGKPYIYSFELQFWYM
jgi:hypothetical protein